ncbi:MAG: CHRD domain-containing protein, partial [Halobacteriales archaeon]|nr:CHRD domain-containing protein [Halobacteriales archaeon]
MRRILVGLTLTLAAGAGCSDATRGPTEYDELTLPVFQTPAVASVDHFHAHATGSEEVPAVPTRAQGQATFQVSRDGGSIDFKLNVANIEDVLMAHIHMGPPGTNGPVVVWLYPDGPPPS